MNKQNIDVSIDNDLAEILTGLAKVQKQLPSKLFYDERGSRLFDEICELEEYYPTRTELKIMQDNIDEIASLFNNETLFIEFGSGSSLKTRLLLEHLDEIAGYIPIDISEEYLLKCADELRKEFPGINIYPVPGDYTKPLDLPEVTNKVSHKIAYFPGSTIGNFQVNEAKEFLKVIHNLVDKNGGLLIGVDLKKDINILENAYNDSKGITAEFNLNILRRLNREYGFDFVINNFEHNAFYNDKFGRIEMHLISKCDQEFGQNGNKFFIKENETILTEYSHKYSLKEFEELAADYFSVEKIWIDENKLFSVQYLASK